MPAGCRRALIEAAQPLHRSGQVGLVSVADGDSPADAGCAQFPRPAAVLARRSRGVRGAAGLRLYRDRAAQPVRNDHQERDRPGAAVRRRQRHLGLRAVHLARPVCELSLRTCNHRLCGARCHRRDLPAGAGADVDLRRADRAQPGDHHRASSERRDRRRDRRRSRARTSCATGSPPAGSVLRSVPMVRCMRCPGRASGASSKQLPAACTLPRRRHERRNRQEPCHLGHRSGAERG